MEYEIIYYPFPKPVEEMSRPELKEYNAWFHRILPGRIAILAGAVRATLGYEHWQPDCSPESLKPLGEWFLEKAEMRPLTEGEYTHLQSEGVSRAKVLGWALTSETTSLAMDIAMYISQVLLQNHPSLKWDQQLKRKRSLDYGQPLLTGFRGGKQFNPIRTVVQHARMLKWEWERSLGTRLLEIYETWSKDANSAM